MSEPTKSNYQPLEMEARWYQHWESKGYFKSVPDHREAFTIVIPPPNVTGVLHMGHLLNNTVQDILIRKARLDGKNACWVPGTDHASIATEAKVVQWLRKEKKLRKADLTREEFLAYAWQWKEEYGGLILKQLRRLGASCDWDRTAFTLDPQYHADVLHVFVDLYKKDKLYRGKRMVNWDPEAKTVLSNEEVIYHEEPSAFYHIHYKQPDGSEGITVATVRPETIFVDAAVAVHPQDDRYKHLIGKMVCIPLINRPIPVIADSYVDRELGTGALKVTPAHDINDYEIGQRHNLEVIDTLTDDGKISANCTFLPLVGLDRFEARKQMEGLLTDAGNLVKLEPFIGKVGRSERTNSVVEPKLSLQWFVKMDELKGPAIDAVHQKVVKFLPDSFRNLYRNWMDNLRDWCISRQLWWGQQIPAWYLKSEPLGQETEAFVGLTVEEALLAAKVKTGNPNLEVSDLRRDEDVLDTWASSWIWPISVFNGFQEPEGEIKYYYPTAVVVTGWDIIFFWVARMIMAGYEFKDEAPFKAVYFTGMVRDKQRRKMSKSLGNSPDSLELLDQFGADGVRFGLMSGASAGGDIMFDEKLCETGRNFANKIWNASTGAVLGWTVAPKAIDAATAATNALAVKWIRARFKDTLTKMDKAFKQYNLFEALNILYHFVWDDLFSWYIEMVKPAYGLTIDAKTYNETIDIFSEAMVALHPFMPFVTEEIWHKLKTRATGDDCCLQTYPKKGKGNVQILEAVAAACEVVVNIREIRAQNKLKPRDLLVAMLQQSERAAKLMQTKGWATLVVKMANLESLSLCSETPENSKTFVCATEQYFIVLPNTIDVEEERLKLQKELEQQQKFYNAVNAKLSNERFVASAPAPIIEGERKKMADAQARITLLQQSIEHLG